MWRSLGAVLLLAACAATPAPEVTITAAGDYGWTAQTESVMTTIADTDPDLHLALGDLSYADRTPEQWCQEVNSALGDDAPFSLLPGNHESDGQDGFIDEFAACLPNRQETLVGEYPRQYYLDLPAADPVVRVIATSAGLTFPEGTRRYEAGDADYEWTKAAIEGARDLPFVIVAAHLPCLTVGVHECGLSADFVDLLIDEQVDLVLHGHEHGYQRTYPLACIDSPECIADSGTIFATVGTGGAAVREVEPGSPFFAALSGSNLEPAYGVLEIQVSAVELRAEFVPAEPTDFADAFTIAR